MTETNKYANNNQSTKPTPRAWNNITSDEMKLFIGVLILMGIIKLPRLEMYWQVANEHIKTPGISRIIGKTKFEQIFRFLHLADNTQDPGNDKLYKIRRFATLLKTQFEAQYTVHQHVTIDEAMIPFKGRLSFKQYMKAKPTKWGIKVFVISDATNGYVYQIQIYTGRGVESDMLLLASVQG